MLRTTLLGLLGATLLSGSPGRAAVPSWSGTAAAPAAVWRAPVDGALVVTRAFRAPAARWSAGHRGVDLAATPGTPVRAAGAGVVVFAGLVAGTPVVSVAHAGGLRTTYEPVLPAVRAGRAVAAGEVLGALQPGHAGCPAAACLHWGARRGEVYLDPLLLLRPPRLRLLPPVDDG